MLAKFKPFRYLQKLWCQPVSHRWVPIFGVATLVFAIGWLASSSNLQASIIANSSALETIRPYVAEVRTAQTDYRAAIGQGNGGAYDQYQSALLCTDQLDDKLQSLKELRGSYRRLGTQIGLREREQRLRALLPKVENQARTIVREIFTVAEEEALLMRADDLKLNFEKVTARLANCLETFKNVERCGAEIQAFLVAEEEIKQEILAIQNMSVEKEQEAQKRLEPLQKESEQLWYKSEQELFDEGRQLSSLWLKIQARQLKAEAPPSSGDQAIASAIETGTRIGTTIGNAAKIITSPLAGAAAMLGPEGILGAGKDIVNGISTGLFGAPLFPDASPSAGGGDGSGATTISGSDANYLDSGDPWDNDTTPKGFYPANGYGLYDVGGNVWEWVNDWYHEDYYEVSPSNDPQGFPDGTEKVLRGGSFSGELGMRVAFRLHFSPIIENTIIGFRCAR